MLKYYIPCLVLFVIYPFSPLFSKANVQGETGAAFSLAIVQEETFAAKLQPAGGFGYTLRILFLPQLGLSSGMGVQVTGRSNALSGFTYKGYSGFFMSLGLLGKFPLKSPPAYSRVWIGSSAALRGSYVQYELTDLYFFYLSLVVEPFVEIDMIEQSTWKLALGLPLGVDFRQDVDFSLAIGFGIHVIHTMRSRAP